MISSSQSTAQHTPTPWQTSVSAFTGQHYVVSVMDDNKEAKEIRRVVCTMNDHAKDWRTEEMEANAQFIVQACNAHAGLVEALRDVLRNATDKARYISMLEGRDVITCEQSDEALDSPEMARARSALSKLEGGT